MAILPSDPVLDAAEAALAAHAPIVVLTGRAGTGKSYFIRALAEQEDVAQAILAPTGLAAMNIGGQTVHSFFGFPPRPLIHHNEKPGWFFSRNARHLSRLIVDEISMLRADTLDAMDSALRAARKIAKPFGGVQMLLVGDFYQLPPVVRGDEGRLLEEAGYASPYAFSAHALRDPPISAFELTEVRRQSDADFVALLTSLRERHELAEAVAALNQACVERKLAQRPVLLTATNAVADRYNAQGLANLPGEPTIFSGAFEGEAKGNLSERLPAPMQLALKRGARVIFTQNDSEGRWVNGSLGAVDSYDDEIIRVRIDSDRNLVEVARATWPQARWQWNASERKMEVQEEFKYNQFPLAHAWALTIHKAQGMTLDAVEIDLGRGAFAPGQTYVALSRARSMEGLRLTRALRVRDVQVDPMIAEGMTQLGL